jgi:hypothetical protein
LQQKLEYRQRIGLRWSPSYASVETRKHIAHINGFVRILHGVLTPLFATAKGGRWDIATTANGCDQATWVKGNAHATVVGAAGWVPGHTDIPKFDQQVFHRL